MSQVFITVTNYSRFSGLKHLSFYGHNPQNSGISTRLGWVILLLHVASTRVNQWYSAVFWASPEGPRRLHKPIFGARGSQGDCAQMGPFSM